MGGSVKKAFSGGIGGAIKGAVLGPMGATTLGGLGAAKSSGVSDLLFGKEAKAQKSGYLPLDQTQVKALGKYNTLMDTDTKNLAEGQVNRNEAAIRTGGDDATRQAQSLVAQRGLGNSSVGINAILNQKRDMGEKIASNRALLPSLQYDMNLKNLNASTDGIQSILGSRIYQQGNPGGQKQGGIAGLLGAGAGALYGGPQGAMAGYSLGNSIGNFT